jgi:hypothetical protein
MPQGTNLLKLIAGAKPAVKTASSAYNRAVHAQMAGSINAHTGKVWTKKPVWEEIIDDLQPGTWIDRAAKVAPPAVGRALLSAKNTYERPFDFVYDALNPWEMRDLYHRAYDTQGKNAQLSRLIAGGADSVLSGTLGAVKTLIPTAAPVFSAFSAGNLGLGHFADTVNLPGGLNPFKYKIPIAHDPDEAHDEYDREYNKGVYQHNAGVNKDIDETNNYWNNANNQAQFFHQMAVKIVTDGNKRGLPKATIQAQLKKLHDQYDTGAQRLSDKRFWPSPAYYNPALNPWDRR